MVTALLEPQETNAVENARSAIDTLIQNGAMYDIAAMFAAFSDPTRLKLLYALSCGELCVGDLAGLAGVSASAVSHHLQGLRALRLVKFRREGKTVLYSLDDDHVSNLLEVGAEHAGEWTRRPQTVAAAISKGERP